MKFMLFITVFCSALVAQSGAPAGKVDSSHPRQRVEAVEIIKQFEQALEKQDVAAIEPLVANDLVVFENGEVNRGWADFRDNHLTPEFREPAPQMDRKVVKVKAGGNLAWGYTEGAFMSTNQDRIRIHRILYSIYALERRSGQWKIVSLTWSLKPR